MSKDPDFYEILGISRQATPEEIRAAYREAARTLHPDVNVLPGQTELFLQKQSAYEVLSNPDKRKVYDQSLPPEEAEQTLITRRSPFEELSTTICFSRTAIPRLNEPQLLYAMIQLAAPFQPDRTGADAVPPLNLAVVIDRSTSMQGERMDTVKAGVVELVKQLRPQDVFSLVAFSDRADTIHAADFVTKPNEIKTAIQRIHTGGGTEMYRGLQAGMDELRRNLHPAYINHLILITDGRTYGDSQDCLELSRWAAGMGISISALGIGSAWNDEFLDELATSSGGVSSFISHPSDIPTYLQDRLSDLGQTFATQIHLALTLHPSIILQDVFRFEPDAARLPVGNNIPLGSIPKNESVSYLLEFLLPPIPGQISRFTVLKGKLSYNTISSQQTQIPLDFDYSLPVAPPAELETEYPPKSIVQAASRVTFYRMQERARREAARGRYDTAANRLQTLATHLMKQGNNQLANTILVEADRLRRTRTFSDEGEKRIKYGTRAFLLPATEKEEQI